MATQIKWTPGMKIQMDPDAVLDYTFDFTEWLDGGTLAAVNATPTNCVAVAAAIEGATVKVRVSNVQSGASVKLRATMADGQADDFTVGFLPTSK